MIGFDRSALVASPDSSGFANQNVNRVVVRFITKVFWSILSKSIDGTKALLVSSPAPRDRTPVLAAQLQRGQRGCKDVPVVRMRFDDREVLMVEVYNDVAVRRCPLALSESLAMLSEG